MPQVDERLDHEQVDAALEQSVDLLAEGRPDRGVVEVEQLARRRPERADRARDEGVATGDVAGLAGDLGGPAVEASRVAGQPERREPDPVRPERGRLDQLRAGVEVLAVDRADEVRPGRRELVEAGPLRDAAGEQQRPHPAVEQDRRPGQALPEPLPLVHGRSLPEAVTVPRRRTTSSRPSASSRTWGGRGRPL